MKKSNLRNKILKFIFTFFLIVNYIGIHQIYSAYNSPAHACGCAYCAVVIASCSQLACSCQSTDETSVVQIGGLTGGTLAWDLYQFQMHEEWIIKNVWEAHVLPSMMLMAGQMTVIALQQMEMLGGLFDAKHQLESQRLLQDLQAQAHKDYQPSTGMCRFGTNTRSLGAADRNTELTQIALAARATQRNLMNQGALGTGSERDDSRSRLDQFVTTYCNPADFGNALDLLCDGAEIGRQNKDVNYTNNVQDQDTLLINFANAEVTPEEEDVLALSLNLYGNELLPQIRDIFIAELNGDYVDGGSKLYMDTRALTAKRSVAFNSFAAIAGLRAQGPESVVPYMTEILEEMGIPEENIEAMLKGSPSYNAQMEILTKKLYQSPNFYSDLYDKPVNIDRKDVSMQAIGLMQKRDMYRSQLRSEANMAIWLETEVETLQDYHNNEVSKLREGAEVLFNLGL